MWSFDQSEPKTITETEISISWSDRWVVPKGFSLRHQRGNQGDANFLPHHSDLITPNLSLAPSHSYWPSAKKHPAFPPDWQEAGIAIGSHEKPWVVAVREREAQVAPTVCAEATGRGGARRHPRIHGCARSSPPPAHSRPPWTHWAGLAPSPAPRLVLNHEPQKVTRRTKPPRRLSRMGGSQFWGGPGQDGDRRWGKDNFASHSKLHRSSECCSAGGLPRSCPFALMGWLGGCQARLHPPHCSSAANPPLLTWSLCPVGPTHFREGGRVGC